MPGVLVAVPEELKVKVAELPVDELEFDQNEAEEAEYELKEDTLKRSRSGNTEARKRPRPKCYNCTYEGCDKAFTRPCRLEEHLRSHTGERPFKCTFEGCDKDFLRDSHLKAHESSHRAEKRYKCPECDHGFNTNQHLKRHLVTHEKRMPYVCSFESCTAEFHKQSQLRKHVSDEHTHMKPFVCVVAGCGRSFAQNSRLKLHEERDHSSQPRYLCGHTNTLESGEPGAPCGSRFHTWSALQKHIKIDHRAMCNVCGTVFVKTSVLKMHMRLHEATLEERRKFVCEFCGNKFTRRHAMVVHQQTVHEGKKPFACVAEGCTRAFGHKRLLKEHVLKAHTKKKDEEAVKSVGVEDVIKGVSRTPLIVQSDLIDRLAGTGYEQTGRFIPCTYVGCQFRFAREYDLERHLSSHLDLDLGLDDIPGLEERMDLQSDILVDPSLL